MNNKVFLIEDNLDVIDVYKTALESANIKVDAIPTGKEAMKRIKEIQENKKEKPSLVLLDLVLPDINGLEILRAIRENAVSKDMVVFIFSNYNSEALQNIQYIKPDKFILKSSITPTKLIELVTPYVKK